MLLPLTDDKHHNLLGLLAGCWLALPSRDPTAQPDGRPGIPAVQWTPRTPPTPSPTPPPPPPPDKPCCCRNNGLDFRSSDCRPDAVAEPLPVLVVFFFFFFIVVVVVASDTDFRCGVVSVVVVAVVGVVVVVVVEDVGVVAASGAPCDGPGASR